MEFIWFNTAEKSCDISSREFHHADNVDNYMNEIMLMKKPILSQKNYTQDTYQCGTNFWS